MTSRFRLALAWYEGLSGALALILLAPAHTAPVLLLPLVAFFFLSLVAGLALGSRHRLGIPLSALVQGLQCVYATNDFFSFRLTSLFDFSIFYQTPDVGFRFVVGPQIHLALGGEPERIVWGLNVVAVFLLTTLLRLPEQGTSEASRSTGAHGPGPPSGA